MSTAVATDHVPAARARERVTQAHVIRSEWTKLWSLRSTRWSLLAAVVAQAALGILIAAVQMNRWTHLDPHDRATFDSIDAGVGGYHLAQLAIGVLGVMIISSEYSTGMIRSSFMAVPKRLPVLWAKIGVFSVGHVRADADLGGRVVLRRAGHRHPAPRPARHRRPARPARRRSAPRCSSPCSASWPPASAP